MLSRYALAGLTAFSTLFAHGQSQILRTVDDFGHNPTDLTMKIYVPTNVSPNPAVILAIHPCFGSADSYYQQTEYPAHADTHGFIVVYPETNNDFSCWDVASPASLTRDGGGDTTGLLSMLNYTLATYNADASRLFVTGSSSGCMMTNVLIGLYPDVFAAASCYSGVAAGCLAGSPGSSPITADPACAAGEIDKSGEQWAEIVREMYPGYDGQRPRFMTLHGTADSVVDFRNLGEQVEQWTTVLGVEETAREVDTPERRYTKIVFGDGTRFVAYEAEGVGHTVPVHEELDLEWFGLI